MSEKKVDSLTDEQAVKEYLSDEKVSSNLATWAQHLGIRFHNNWFTKEKMVKKTVLKNIAEADQLLGLLILKGHAVQKQFGNEIRYKVTISGEERLKLLKEHLAAIEQQAASVRDSIATLEAEIARSNKI